MNKKTIFFTSIITTIVIILIYLIYQCWFKSPSLTNSTPTLEILTEQNQPTILPTTKIHQQLQEPQPKTEKLTPKSKELTPKPEELILKSEDSTPKPIVPTSKPEESISKSEKSKTYKEIFQQNYNECSELLKKMQLEQQKEKQHDELEKFYRQFSSILLIKENAEIIKTTNPTTNKRIDKIILNDETKTEYIFEYDKPELHLITSKKYINNKIKEENIYNFNTTNPIKKTVYQKGKIYSIADFNIKTGKKIKHTSYKDYTTNQIACTDTYDFTTVILFDLIITTPTAKQSVGSLTTTLKQAKKFN